ncbi:hypothetical protein F3Y22_tig00112498pilonHSYRG00067 [Hibiscus syriacus]|uniref:DC1 domain-containing protein n=2 Tax=Hibiscus syriacus TaxID=106335 RepID=A0A6A2XGU6_HIBSY|nr:hypothetical protein F3Y22_tig00112498pilonHSYRG00067 [Hibiscus syriacus]
MEEETDRKCDGCMLPVSTNLFYYCLESDCHFCLHKNCAKLPRIKQHWFRQSNATLQSAVFLKCCLCNRCCSGFFYNIGGYYNVCIRCAKVPDEDQGHQHFLSFDFKCWERCKGCGAASNGWGALKCRSCKFALDFVCLTLPHSALHKVDQQILYLTYHDDNDYSNHCYCDICERERDPNL